MHPVLFEIFGVSVTAYGAIKALAALVAAWVLARAFRRLGWNAEHAQTIVLAAAVIGLRARSCTTLLPRVAVTA